MLTFLGPGGRLCDGQTRREILRVGGLGAFGLAGGLSLADLLRVEARAATSQATPRRTKSCILLMLMGGPPQHSTWDPKPEAPAEVRGPYGPIATSVPGLSICELLPLTARHADKLCLLRAVATDDNAHSSSGYYMLTGRPHAPKNLEDVNPLPPNDFPSLGALVNRFTGSDVPLPPAVTLPHRIINTSGSRWPGQDAGFLGRARDPWLLNARLGADGYRVEEIQLPAELDLERVDRRRSLLDAVGHGIDHLQADTTCRVLDTHTTRAYDLLRAPAARRAFQVEQESEAVHELYGRTPFGQGVLMARRLVEAGVRLVQVNWYRGPDEPPMNPVWDSHVDEPNRLKTVLAPPMDRAFSGLLQDLADRGLLDDTLVVCMAEFGRSPKLDPNGGRGHWGHVFSIALAGGGVRGGQVYGASDRMAAYPREGRVAPEDLAATILDRLGIDPASEYHDPLSRPHLAARGEVLRHLF